MLFKECFSDSVQQETDVSWNKILILKLSWLYCLYIIRYRISSIDLDINCKMAVFSEKKIILCRSVNLASIGVLFFTKRRLSFCLIFSLILRKCLLELAFFFDHFTSFHWNFAQNKCKEVGVSLVQNYHMTWSAFALFLARRTELAFHIRHF